MFRTLCAIVIAIVAGIHPLSAQIYVLAGSPTPKYNVEYATKLLEVTSEGKLQQVAEVNGKDEGSEWIAVSDELRKAVVVVRAVNRVAVIDLNTASVSKRCIWPHQRGDSLIDRWIVDSPVSGPLLVEFLAGDDVTKAYLRGMVLDASIPCEKSFLAVDPIDMRYIMASGSSGPDDTGSGDGLAQVGVDREGNITRLFPSGTASLGYQVPSEYIKEVSVSFCVLQVNVKQILALSATEYNDPKVAKSFVLRKRDGTWRRLPQFGERTWDLRGFGAYVAYSEARTKDAKAQETPGRPEWRAQDSATGPSMTGRFENSRYVFPGVLHIYDVDTDHTYTIPTNQGDSEILLIEGKTVYYRVSDRLYSVPIVENGLGTPYLVATSDFIRDAHWAFLRQSR